MGNPLSYLGYDVGVFSRRRLRHPTIHRNAVAVLVCVTAFLIGCHQAPIEPITLTFLDPEWSHDSRERDASHEAVLADFTKETGIRVTHLPGPENASAQLGLTESLLKKGAATPDVYGIDVIWPGMLSEYLVDLKPYVLAEPQPNDPELIANYTVKGRLVAMPYHSNVGALHYRTDLLEKYGYREPPRTLDELEKMATRIQAGERANGQKDFWGYVWPGAAGEGLFCDALEWQVAEGGGHVVEADGEVSVNNPNTIRAWKRAARWIGTISPPAVLSYQEWDSSNAFWTSGRAAFQRGWESDYFIANPVLAYPFNDRAGMTSMPGAKGARVGTLGGLGLAVSRLSIHQTEAIALVRFLLKKEAELDHQRATSTAPKSPVRFEIPTILTAYIHQQETGGVAGARVVARPSTVTGDKYSAVSSAYVQTLHSVLERKVDVETAAASLQKQLSQIMASQ
ncbi:MAG TPA: extracellular solute-binding protein [Candidatus Sulfotelmatobacter sp.]|nr:extracellular solute-binding protein [Candidatus Sulfotelmatobacter sp.]